MQAESPAMDQTEKPIADMSFEEAMAELETVVRALEDGRVPLDRAIDLYERGEALRVHCEDRLKKAEMRVEKIMKTRDGDIATDPLEPR